MKTLTLRNLPQELRQRIRRKAHDEGISATQAAIRLLRQGAGLQEGKKARRVYHDLDWLAGSWSKERADEFDRFLKQHRRIDPELWQ